MSIKDFFHSLFRPRHIDAVLHCPEEQWIPSYGAVVYTWALVGLDGYMIKAATVQLWGEHDCPSDVAAWVLSPTDQRFCFTYCGETDWCLNYQQNLTEALRGERADGRWEIRIEDMIPGDGGYVGAVMLCLTLVNRHSLAFWSRPRITPAAHCQSTDTDGTVANKHRKRQRGTH